jgi:hypothetical protein
MFQNFERLSRDLNGNARISLWDLEDTWLENLKEEQSYY